MVTPANTDGWRGVPRLIHGRKRNHAWTHPDYPGIVIRHCGHATATYPYFIIGVEDMQTFRTLQDAKSFLAQQEKK